MTKYLLTELALCKSRNLAIFSCFIVLLFAKQATNAQDNYANYYNMVDSANFYSLVDSNYVKAFVKYNECFKQFVPFTKDVDRAIVLGIKTNQNIDSLLYLNFKLGAKKSDVKYILNKEEYEIKRAYLNKIESKAKKESKKYRNKKNRKLIRRLLIKDQLARLWFSKSNRIQRIDSLNAFRLIKEYRNGNNFNRIALGELHSSLLGVLIFHQGWENYQGEMSMLFNLTKSGALSRDDLIYLFQRANLFNGIRFEVDEENTIIKSAKNSTLLCDANHFTSCIGEQLRRINGKIIFTPIDPDIEEMEINKLRVILFSPPLYYYKSIEKRYRCSIEEYCNLITE
jgi:hypothetical protein